MKLLAHLRNENGIRFEQTLKDHCEKTAEYAAACISVVSLEHTAYLAGLLHDVGKAKKAFMNYLEDVYQGEKVIRGSVNHTFAGVIYILEKYHNEDSDAITCLTSEMISCAIGGHHGIFDCSDLEGNNGFLHRLQKNKNEIDYDESVHNYFSEVVKESTVEELFQKSVKEVGELVQSIKYHCDNDSSKIWFQIGMSVRLLQSAVIYGDRRDTREFMTGEIKKEEERPAWEPQSIFLETKLNEFVADSEINKVRAVISDKCLDFSDRPCGIYRLDIPTGSGKTLATLRYAINHAKKYNKKRIIFIIPLLSVLDQNALVIRDYISDQNMILEHHSNLIREVEDEETLDPYETLLEDWHSPIIISTLVQFLNILFKDKTSAIERMQALCDSVIVIDEVQSLPVKVTAMFNMALNFLNQVCHATIVLSSATLPCLERLDYWPLKLADEPDMVSLNEDELSVFRRAEIINKTTPYGMTLDECADFCRESIDKYSSVLLVCNTKKEARELFKRMQEMAEKDWQIFHLSTSMCQAHRSETFREVQKQLDIFQGKLSDRKQNKKILCISTQLVEAGVDFSFECVIRVLAGIDNLAQAAGRCNRSNEYSHLGKVYMINLKDENLSMLPEIARTQDSTRKILAINTSLKGEKLLETETASQYFDVLYQQADREVKYPFKYYGNTLYMADMLANINEFARDRTFILRQPFKTMGKMFQVFEDETIDVLVPYGDGRELIKKLQNIKDVSSAYKELQLILNRAKPYTINIFNYQKDKLEMNGLLQSACDGRIWVLDENSYHDVYGLDDNTEMSAENYIV